MSQFPPKEVPYNQRVLLRIIGEAETYTGKKKSKLYLLAGERKIKLVKDGARTYAVRESLDTYMASLKDFKSSA